MRVASSARASRDCRRRGRWSIAGTPSRSSSAGALPAGASPRASSAPIELPRGLSGEVAFDHGAQYFTVRDQRFSELAAEWERDRVIAKWTGRIVSFDGEGWEDVDEGTSRYVGTPGMSAIAAALAAGLDIEFGTKIESLDPLLQRFRSRDRRGARRSGARAGRRHSVARLRRSPASR